MTKILLETLKGNPSDRVPFWFMRQAGRYLPEYREIRQNAPSFMDFCYNPDQATEVTLQPIRRYGMDGAILFADILVVPDGLGQKVWFEAGHGPKLTPVNTEETYAELSLNGFHDKVGNVYETVSRLSKELPEEVTLIGFAGAPWTVATYVIEGAGSKDHAAVRQMGYGNPELFGKILDLLVDATSEYLCAQIDAGANVVQIFDSWSAAIPEPYFHKWIIEPTREIVARVRAKHNETPIIGFPRLSGAMLETYVLETKVDGVSLDTGVPLDWARDSVQRHVCVQGNMDPHLVVSGGDAMVNEATRILDTLKGGSHIFNLGHGFVPQTPPENVALLSETIKNFRR
ncbi:uroporphyrinogen decarboxylase [Kordiimonas sp. SCSIO 12610]|uniref:uroporphyrinogen decarboxylase n=1 Tax=Kordiimonas sp. SCSIO 12610 TaxID=2829597 RepID=UPI002108D844|nr:uroporphyrinogen decarboxylase [Kordiimonas sp. SCSIO 12610]UTW55472.1 uroporphyrinogen decarboxylase [Kordiimonas sp. SCSIO 12610]